MENNNFVKFALEQLEVEEKLIKEVIHALCQTIIYHRALGPVTINFQTCETMNKITYMKCGEKQVDIDLNDLAEKILQLKDKQQSIVVVNIDFFQEDKSSILWIFNKKESKLFEKWQIPLKIYKSDFL